MKCLYIYSHPDSPQESLGLLALDPLAVEAAVGQYVDIEQRGNIFPRVIELAHFTLISDDKTVVHNFESTHVDSGFNPLHNLS